MKCCCYILAGTNQSSLSNFGTIEKAFQRPCRRLFSTILIASHYFSLFFGRCPGELQSLVPLVQTFARKTRYATYIALARPHCLNIPLVRQLFFLRTVALWNRLWRELFSDHYNLNRFKSQPLTLDISWYTHLSLSLFLKRPLLWVVLELCIWGIIIKSEKCGSRKDLITWLKYINHLVEAGELFSCWGFVLLAMNLIVIEDNP